MKIRRMLLTVIIAVFTLVSNTPAQDGERNLSMSGSFTDGSATGMFSYGFKDGVFKQPIVFIGSNGRVYRAIIENNKLAELYVNGEKTSVDRIDQDPAADRKLARLIEMRRELDKLESEHGEMEKQSAIIEVSATGVADKSMKLSELENDLDDDRDKLENAREDGNSKKISDLKARIEKKQRELDKLREELESEERRLETSSEAISGRAEILSGKWEEYGEFQQQEMNKVLESIVSEIRSSGMASGGKVSFKLSNRELVVNGKTATPELFEKLRNIYVGDDPRGTYGFMYNWKFKRNTF